MTRPIGSLMGLVRLFKILFVPCAATLYQSKGSTYALKLCGLIRSVFIQSCGSFPAGDFLMNQQLLRHSSFKCSFVKICLYVSFGDQACERYFLPHYKSHSFQAK